MTVNNAINDMAQEVQKECSHDTSLAIGSIENPAEAVPVLIDRMDNICALMDYQATLISYAEHDLEEAKFIYKRKENIAKKKYNESFIHYKQEDRLKPKDQRRTDKEYEAMAELDSNIEVNESLSAEKVYLTAQHAVEDTKHKYETLNNHFLGYRKACDLLSKEMSKLGDPAARFSRPGSY